MSAIRRGAGYVLMGGGLLAAGALAAGVPMGSGGMHDSKYLVGSPVSIGGCVAVAVVGVMLVLVKRTNPSR